MTTKELIEALQHEDPEGTNQVVVGGTPIYYVDRQPGYYDGSYAELIQDPTRAGRYNIIGIRHRRDGTKIKIVLMNTDDVIWDNPEALVELHPSLGEQRIKAMTGEIEHERNEARKCVAEIEAKRITNATLTSGTLSEKENKDG